MEEMPNLSLNQLPEEPEKPIDSKRELFTDTWRRFRSRFSDFSLEGVHISEDLGIVSSNHERDTDDDDDDLSDEDDDTDDVKKTTKMKNKFKKILQFNDEPSEIKTESQEKILKKDDNLINEEIFIEEEFINENIEIDNDIKKFNRDNDYSKEPNIDEIDDSPNDDVVSIKQVIDNKRQTSSANLATHNTFNYNYPQNVYVDSRESVVYRQRNGGLIALDILNYGLALRRDNKNKRLSDKKIKKLSDEVKKKFGYMNNEKKGEKNKNELKIRHESPILKKTSVVNKININNEQYSNNIKLNQQETINIIHKEVSDYSINNNYEKKMIFENNMNVPDKKSNDNINKFETLEKKFENIENKQNKNYKLNNSIKDSVSYFNLQSSSEHQKNINNPKQDIRIPNSSIIKENTDYKNIIMPGIWGAVTGIIVFLIFYMVTIR